MSKHRAVINGKYYEGLTERQLAEARRANRGGKFDKEMQQGESAVDIIQPWLGGKPNPEFIKAYPRKSQSIFSNQELSEVIT